MSEIPPHIRSADEVLQLASRIVDADAAEVRAQTSVSCQAGCSACCVQAVPVTASELRLLHQVMNELSDDDRAEVERTANDNAAQAQAAGIQAMVVPGEPGNRERDPGARYGSLGLPCPFLKDNRCSVYEKRPLVCREYQVRSDPKHCVPGSSGIVSVVTWSRDAVTGFRRISARLGEPEIYILGASLSSPPPPMPTAALTPSGPLMLLLTSLTRQVDETG